jgi:hypothetical protein
MEARVYETRFIEGILCTIEPPICGHTVPSIHINS